MSGEAFVPLVPDAYDELARYLRRAPAPSGSYDDDVARAERFRAVAAAVKRLNFALKLLSFPLFVVGLAAAVAGWVRPDVWFAWFFPGLQAVLAALLTRLFGALVDLETRALQPVTIAVIAGASP